MTIAQDVLIIILMGVSGSGKTTIGQFLTRNSVGGSMMEMTFIPKPMLTR